MIAVRRVQRTGLQYEAAGVATFWRRAFAPRVTGCIRAQAPGRKGLGVPVPARSRW
ncbi:hypothetical protein LC55x_1410 [Lysobacter capsici]|nr:hypothetical protein LC55x_1410 [Lysobacter capsici]